MKDLEARFHQAMIGIYYAAKTKAKYNATIFLRMVTDHGGLIAAKQLINSEKPSDGYTALYLKGH